MATETPKTAPEQVAYANLLFYGSWSAIAILVITYLIYISGIMGSYVPLEKITYYWSHPVHDYLTEMNVPTGWGWVGLLGHGDFLNFIGIVILAGMTIVCCLRVLPFYLAAKDTVFAVIVVLEVVVLCLGASGIFGSGGH